jgi:hypothetical protein
LNSAGPHKLARVLELCLNYLSSPATESLGPDRIVAVDLRYPSIGLSASQKPDQEVFDNPKLTSVAKAVPVVTLPSLQASTESLTFVDRSEDFFLMKNMVENLPQAITVSPVSRSKVLLVEDNFINMKVC